MGAERVLDGDVVERESINKREKNSWTWTTVR